MSVYGSDKYFNPIYGSQENLELLIHGTILVFVNFVRSIQQNHRFLSGSVANVNNSLRELLT